MGEDTEEGTADDDEDDDGGGDVESWAGDLRSLSFVRERVECFMFSLTLPPEGFVEITGYFSASERFLGLNMTLDLLSEVPFSLSE